MPEAQPAKTYPAHDEHPTERVAVAVDPYDLADKAKIFSVQYSELGFVPIFVAVTNDGDQPVQLAGMKAQLVTASRTKLSPASDDDITRRLARPSASTNRYPIPFPSKKVKGGASKQAYRRSRMPSLLPRQSSLIARNPDFCSSMSRAFPCPWRAHTSISPGCETQKATN